MPIDWQSLLHFILSLVVGLCGFIIAGVKTSIDKLAEQVSHLCTHIAVTKEWRDMHDKKHEEMSHSLTEDNRDVWQAIDKIREEK